MGWIYIGADNKDHNWSKLGKTTGELTTRHTSSQRPSYYIFMAFEVIRGDVHRIESELIGYLDSLHGIERERHVSTGSKSECFLIGPYQMADIVKSFLLDKFPSSFYFNNLTQDISYFESQLANNDSNLMGNQNITKPLVSNNQSDLDWYEGPASGWGDLEDKPEPAPSNLRMRKEKYFTNNTIEFVGDLGGGHYIDYESGREFYRDENGNITWKW
ncbi:hypothetical protein [Pseudoalteromonas sp. MMG024]|uniref:hypothetical protein n=1 Tax=Pseudoalteromonas sp. MMG024 TaxID=2909980 RepID=UPI001F44E88E|nr:hypothetical protein [Pseudoalteromonas sp. MMG024]MCF6459222.1 hypothetical protein [Pseudoalteromonas sp. MMG024]